MPDFPGVVTSFARGLASKIAASGVASVAHRLYTDENGRLYVGDGSTLLKALSALARMTEVLQVATPEAFGAKGDVQIKKATVAITSGQNRLTWPTNIFKASDQGKLLVLTQGGASSATGSVSSVPVTAPGSGYTSIPTASINAGGGSNCSLLVAMRVVAATVNAGGSGYLAGGSGTVTLTLNTGYGIQAQLVCAVTAGVITAVNSISVSGSYSVMPTLAGSSHAFNASGTGATFNLTMGVDSIIVGNVGSGYSLSATTATLTGGTPTTAATLGTPVVLPTKPALVTTISAYVSPTQVDLADSFGNTGSAYRLLAWGSDDSTALINARASLVNGGVLAFSKGKNYGQTSRLTLPDDGTSVTLLGGGADSSRLVALAPMNEQIYKGTIAGLSGLDGFTIEGATLPTHNVNLFGSHRTLHRNLVIRNAAKGGSNVVWGDPTYTGQSYENDLDLSVRIENIEGYSTSADCPNYNLENYGTDNRAESVYAGAYLACLLNANGDLQVGRGHGFGTTTGLTPQFIIWDKGQLSASAFTCDMWAPGGAGIYRDYSFGNAASSYLGITFVYTVQPIAGTHCVRIASGADVSVIGSSFPKVAGIDVFQAADKIVQNGSISSRTVLMGNPGAQTSTGPGVYPSTTANPSAAGSFGLNPHDGSTTGGNPLGFGAVDLSVLRSTAAMVASGIAAFAVGQSVTAAGQGSAAIGSNVSATGANSHVRGNQGSDRGQQGKDVWAVNLFSAVGDQQLSRNIFYLKSTSVTANQRLTIAGGAVAFSSVAQLGLSSAWLIRNARFVGRKVSDGTFVAWSLGDIIVKKGATVGSTVLDGTPTWTLLSSSASGVTAPVFSVDATTYGAPVVTITPPDATEWHWMFAFDTVEIA